MNKLSVFAATLLIAGVASAQQATPLTREQVIADLVAARASGELAQLQGEKGIDVAVPASAKAYAAAQQHLQEAQAVKVVAKPAQTAAAVADHGENAARELGDFSAPIVPRTPAVAGR